MNLFDIKPLRPLMLAIGHRFVGKDAEQAFRFCVSLAVRLMIASSTRTGTVEEGLAEAAHKLFIGNLATVDDLKTELKALTPRNARFVAAFETATL